MCHLHLIHVCNEILLGLKFPCKFLRCNHFDGSLLGFFNGVGFHLECDFFICKHAVNILIKKDFVRNQANPYGISCHVIGISDRKVPTETFADKPSGKWHFNMSGAKKEVIDSVKVSIEKLIQRPFKMTIL